MRIYYKLTCWSSKTHTTVEFGDTPYDIEFWNNPPEGMDFETNWGYLQRTIKDEFVEFWVDTDKYQSEDKETMDMAQKAIFIYRNKMIDDITSVSL